MKQAGGPPHGRYGANAPRSCSRPHSSVVEQQFCKLLVAGSIPAEGFDKLNSRSPRKGRMTAIHGTGDGIVEERNEPSPSDQASA